MDMSICVYFLSRPVKGWPKGAKYPGPGPLKRARQSRTDVQSFVFGVLFGIFLAFVSGVLFQNILHRNHRKFTNGAMKFSGGACPQTSLVICMFQKLGVGFYHNLGVSLLWGLPIIHPGHDG